MSTTTTAAAPTPSPAPVVPDASHHHHSHRRHHHQHRPHEDNLFGGSGEQRIGSLELLRNTPASELLTERRSLVSINQATTIDEALIIMRKHNVSALPVYDTWKRSYIGILTLQDLLNHIAFRNFTEDGSVASSFDNSIAPAVHVLSKNAESLLPTARISASVDDLLEPMSRGFHRLLMSVPTPCATHVPFAESSDIDSSQTELCVVSQTDVLRFIASHINHLSDAVGLGRSLEECQLVNDRIHSITTANTALHGFSVMAQNELSAVPVVDENGHLVANLSASDMRGVTTNLMSRVQLPVLDFLKESNRGRVRYPISVTKSTLLGDAIIKMVLAKVHRLWIESDGKVVGVLSMTDVIRFMSFNRMPDV